MAVIAVLSSPTEQFNNSYLLKKIVTILILFAALQQCLAQEILSPLSYSFRHHSVKSSDTTLLELPFFDDFSDYEGLPDPKRWLTQQAFVNKDYAPEPPSVGMATLDALNERGELYPHASTNLFKADTLASQPIRLDSITGVSKRKLTPSDSIVLSFFFIPGGWYGNPWELVGSTPSQQDSLFLDLYDSQANQWDVVWATPGFSPDTVGIHSHWPWHFASVKIDSAKYFNRNFQFRFRNYASLDPNPKSGISGNCDHWSIDYIYLNHSRNRGDSLFRDVAFVEKAPSMLKYYYAMPARQFTPADMADKLNMKIVNRYNQTLASTYHYVVSNSDGGAVANYEGGYENIPAFFPNGKYQEMPVHCNPPVNFSFPVNGQPSSFVVKHIVCEGVGGDNRKGNDTITFTQNFGDYYAYDDGIPENGYGVVTSGPTGNKVWLALRYDLHSADTLTAVDLFFNRTRGGENENIQFQICVWSCHNGLPSTLLYKDSERNTPAFDGSNLFHRYILKEALRVTDTIFVGFEQLTNDYINLGFDRSNDSRRFTFYRVGNEWMQSILKGSVMLRPAFGSSALVSIEKPKAEAPKVSIFPMPSSGQVNIEIDNATPLEHIQLSLFDLHGRLIIQSPYKNTLDLHHLDNGIYFLRIIDTETGLYSTKKIAIRH